MTSAALWILAIALMLVGALGIVLPALPGIPLMFAGMVVAAAIDDFQRIGWITLTVLGFLTLFSVIIEFAASALGARHVGASRQAVWATTTQPSIASHFQKYAAASLRRPPYSSLRISFLSHVTQTRSPWATP